MQTRYLIWTLFVVLPICALFAYCFHIKKSSWAFVTCFLMYTRKMIFDSFIATKYNTCVIIPFRFAPEHLFLKQHRDRLKPSHCGLFSRTRAPGWASHWKPRYKCFLTELLLPRLSAEVSTSVHARKDTAVQVCQCTEQDKCITGCLQRMKAACIACKGADTGWDRLELAVCGREAGRIRECVPLTCLTVWKLMIIAGWV